MPRERLPFLGLYTLETPPSPRDLFTCFRYERFDKFDEMRLDFSTLLVGLLVVMRAEAGPLRHVRCVSRPGADRLRVEFDAERYRRQEASSTATAKIYGIAEASDEVEGLDRGFDRGLINDDVDDSDYAGITDPQA